MASMVSSTAVASVNRVSPAQSSMVAPFTGLKSASAFPVTQKANHDITSIASNGGRVQCMLVCTWQLVVLFLRKKICLNKQLRPQELNYASTCFMHSGSQKMKKKKKKKKGNYATHRLSEVF